MRENQSDLHRFLETGARLTVTVMIVNIKNRYFRWSRCRTRMLIISNSDCDVVEIAVTSCERRSRVMSRGSTEKDRD